ncbi:unnamed protein product, partial [Brenthis ino]
MRLANCAGDIIVLKCTRRHKCTLYSYHSHTPVGRPLDTTEIIHYSTLIVGDFNLSCIDWDLVDNLSHGQNIPSLPKSLIDFSRVNCFYQVNRIKNQENRILDLVFFNNDILKVKVETSTQVLSRIDPLHPPFDISFSLDDKATKLLDSNPNHIRYNYSKANYTAVNNFLDNVDWSEKLSTHDDVNKMVEILYSVIRSSIELYVPKISKKNNHKYPPGINKTLIKLINEKEKVRLRHKKYKNPSDEISLKLLKKRCDKHSIESYNSYIERSENNVKAHSKYFWSFMKFKKQNKAHALPATMTRNNVEISGGNKICNTFASHFSKIANINTDSVK